MDRKRIIEVLFRMAPADRVAIAMELLASVDSPYDDESAATAAQRAEEADRDPHVLVDGPDTDASMRRLLP